MTDPSVTNHLIENNADIYGWHAFTESLRDPEEQKKGIHNNQVILNKELGIPQGSTLITGGTFKKSSLVLGAFCNKFFTL